MYVGLRNSVRFEQISLVAVVNWKKISETPAYLSRRSATIVLEFVKMP